MLFCAWRYGGEDPYRLFNGPDASPSPYPERVRCFVYGCGLLAAEREIELAGGKVQRRALGG